MRIRHSRDQWAQWIEQQASSELTVKEFCHLHQIQVQSFYNWRARLVARPAETELHNPLFVTLTVRPSNIVEIETKLGRWVAPHGFYRYPKRVVFIKPPIVCDNIQCKILNGGM